MTLFGSIIIPSSRPNLVGGKCDCNIYSLGIKLPPFGANVCDRNSLGFMLPPLSKHSVEYSFFTCPKRPFLTISLLAFSFDVDSAAYAQLIGWPLVWVM